MTISKEDGNLIRAIAILLIVGYHFQYNMFGGTFLVDRGQGFISWLSDSIAYILATPITAPGLLMFPFLIGVNIFFILSGYGLAKKFQNDTGVKANYIIRQSLKVLIPYWIAHPLIHIIDWAIRYLQYKTGFIDYRVYFADMHSIPEYIESALVFPRWFSSQGALTFDGTWWFVGIIIQFYLIFPLLFKLFKKLKPLKAFLICLGISFLYRYIISVTTLSSPIGINQADILLFINFPARLSEFALGMYFALETKDLTNKWGLKDKLNTTSRRIAVGLGMIIIGIITLSHIQTMFISDFLFAFGGINILFAIVKLLKSRENKILNLIGKKSYYIYLYHEPTLRLILKFIFPGWINS